MDQDCETRCQACPAVAARVSWISELGKRRTISAALIEGDTNRIRSVHSRIAALQGPLFPMQAAATEVLSEDRHALCLDRLLEEVTTSIDTTAAGGNGRLIAIA